tara:strand:- start:36 stop:725 length:690 start_codon:yes stop_codon:yes gene_type:complete
MKSFPITCYDNFYDNPDQVREFALDLDYTRSSGFYPGIRTPNLSEVDSKFYEFSYRRVLSLFGDYSETNHSNNYEVLTQFQKISRFSSDPDDPANLGWIHLDTKADLAAVVYLDPDPNLDNGTCIYRKDRPLPPSESIDPDNLPNCMKGYQVDDEFRELIVANNSQYTKTLEVKNCYNRLISYSGDFHGASSYYTQNEEDFRLTQVFFFFGMNIPYESVPQIRCSRYGI